MTRSVAVLALVLVTAFGLAAEERVHFEADVLPALEAAGCNAGSCHGSRKQAEHGGFRISLFGSRPLDDYVAIVDGPSGPLVDMERPERSRLLRRASGEEPHENRTVRVLESTVSTIHQWIREGAVPPGDRRGAIAELRFVRATRDAAVGDLLAFELEAVDATGATSDATQRHRYRVQSIPDGVLTREENRYRVASPGRAVVVARHAGRTAVMTVNVPFGEEPGHEAFDADNLVDRYLSTMWGRFELRPAEPADDFVLARRLRLHLAGRNPDVAELERLAESDEPDKWDRWIEASLADPTAAEHERTLWSEWFDFDKGRRSKEDLRAFRDWFGGELAKGASLESVFTRMLLAEGTVADDPAAGYLLGATTDAGRAAMVARDLLGVNVRCFACHDHPLGERTTDDHEGLVAVLHGIDDISGEGNSRRLVFRSGRHRHPERRSVVPPTVLGERLDVAASGGDVRRAFVEWLFDGENLVFPRVVVSRYWSWLMSRPLLSDEDDAQRLRLVLHPQLLDALARDFVEHDYDVRHLVRTIVTSRAYRFALERNEDATIRNAAAPFHVRRIPQRLPPAALIRAVRQATDVSAEDVPFDGGEPLGGFGRGLGVGRRRGVCEQPSNETYLSSALVMLNSGWLQKTIEHDNGRAHRWAHSDRDWRSYADEVFAATVARRPTKDELDKIRAYCDQELPKPNGRERVAEDLLWALINTKEFLFIP